MKKQFGFLYSLKIAGDIYCLYEHFGMTLENYSKSSKGGKDMKKKLLAALLATTMVFSLTACGDTSTSESSTKASSTTAEDVTLAVAWWGSQNRNDKFTAALDAYTADNPNVTFETQINGFSDHITAISASAASDTMPDLIMLQTDYLKPYTDADKLLDLTPYIESGALDLSNVSDSIISTGIIDGGIYGISAGNNAAALIYNKTLLEANDIEIDNYMNYEEFMDVCREVYQKTGVKTQFDNIATFLEFISRENGTGLFDGAALGADSYEIFLPFFEMIETGLKEGWLMDQSIKTANGGSTDAQAIVNYSTPETQSWCSFFNSNQMVAIQSVAPEGVELDLVTMPCEDPASAYYIRQAMCWTISAGSDNIDEAIEVLNYWINSEKANDIILGEPGVPASDKIATKVAAQLDETTAKTFNFVSEVVSPESSASNPPAESGASRVRDELAVELVEKIAYGEMTAEAAAKEFFDEANKIMADSAS